MGFNLAPSPHPKVSSKVQTVGGGAFRTRQLNWSCLRGRSFQSCRSRNVDDVEDLHNRLKSQRQPVLLVQ